MVAFFSILIGWRFFIAAEAAYNAWSAKKPETALPHPRLTYPVVAVVLLAAALYPSYDEFKRWTSFAAFEVPSASMCPTICLGERIVADMGAYKSRSPQRGDLVPPGTQIVPRTLHQARHRHLWQRCGTGS